MLVLSALTLTPGVCYGHSVVVHERITQTAFNCSKGIQDFLENNSVPQSLTANPPQCGNESQPPVDWLKQGSLMEDEFVKENGTWEIEEF